MSKYSDKFKDPRWQKRRTEIMNRDKFTCRICGDEKNTLNVHHILYKKGAEPWEYEDHELLTVCEKCHAQFIPEFMEGLALFIFAFLLRYKKISPVAIRDLASKKSIKDLDSFLLIVKSDRHGTLMTALESFYSCAFGDGIRALKGLKENE